MEQDILKNKNNSQQNADLKIKLAMNQMLNNVEFNNIYSLLKSEKNVKNFEYNDEFRQKCGEIVDNKIQVELEKIKICSVKLNACFHQQYLLIITVDL